MTILHIIITILILFTICLYVILFNKNIKEMYKSAINKVKPQPKVIKPQATVSPPKASAASLIAKDLAAKAAAKAASKAAAAIIKPVIKSDPKVDKIVEETKKKMLAKVKEQNLAIQTLALIAEEKRRKEAADDEKKERRNQEIKRENKEKERIQQQKEDEKRRQQPTTPKPYKPIDYIALKQAAERRNDAIMFNPANRRYDSPNTQSFNLSAHHQSLASAANPLLQSDYNKGLNLSLYNQQQAAGNWTQQSVQSRQNAWQQQQREKELREKQEYEAREKKKRDLKNEFVAVQRINAQNRRF